MATVIQKQTYVVHSLTEQHGDSTMVRVRLRSTTAVDPAAPLMYDTSVDHIVPLAKAPAIGATVEVALSLVA